MKELNELKECGCRIRFVFNGLEHRVNEHPFDASITAARLNSKAFDVYEQDKATDAITLFRNTGEYSCQFYGHSYLIFI